jgi:hypothetical protein
MAKLKAHSLQIFIANTPQTALEVWLTAIIELECASRTLTLGVIVKEDECL